MEKIFFAIYNKKEKKFAAIYEDGEGTEYFSSVDFSDIGQGGIFKDREIAEFKLKDMINRAGFSVGFTMIFPIDFIRECEVIEIALKFEEK